MPALVCPRCQRANPESAVYCYFDGADLHGRHDGQPFNRLTQDYVFPSGRCCRTFDDFAQACRDEWAAARDLLKQGAFRQFFGSTGRADLARAAQEAMAQADADIGLTTFLGALPVLHLPTPKLDINPRRFLLGNLLAGEHRTLQLIISNQGQGVLQGTLSVVEGSDWFKIEGATNNQLPIVTPREQKITLRVDTRGLAAGQTYGAKMTVITNGGVVEVLARMDLVAQPYPKAPFQGVKTPREMAERMRAQPKAAAPILESGEVSRWFTSNGWDFPIRGQQARGVAGVQQFFETMGLSKPPVVKLSQSELRFACNYPEPLRFQIQLQTHARKWVYGHVTSEAPWLRVLTPQVSGPQQATINLEVDPTAMNNGPQAEAKAQIVANAGQTLSLRVLVEVNGMPAATRRRRREKTQAAAAGSSWFGAVLSMAVAFFVIRLALALFVDTGMRSAAVAEATQRLVSLGTLKHGEERLHASGAWLRLPWPRILTGAPGTFDAKLLSEQAESTVPIGEFQDYFVRYFLRWFVLLTWWLGALGGALVVWRRGGGPGDLLWGLVAGAVAGLAGGATIGCVFLLAEIVPSTIWAVLFGSLGGGPLAWVLWLFVALLGWTLFGATLGFAVSLVAPLERLIMRPVQRLVGELCRICGLHGLAQRCAA